MTQLTQIYDWLTGNVSVWGPLAVVLIDYFIGKNPASSADNILHWVELKIKALLATPPSK
jgi:hypothetical protein